MSSNGNNSDFSMFNEFQKINNPSISPIESINRLLVFDQNNQNSLNPNIYDNTGHSRNLGLINQNPVNRISSSISSATTTANNTNVFNTPHSLFEK